MTLTNSHTDNNEAETHAGTGFYEEQTLMYSYVYFCSFQNRMGGSATNISPEEEI